MHGARHDLLRLIGRVRWRWRTRLLLHGAAIVLGALLAAMLLSAYGLERVNFSPTAILVARVLTAVLVLALAVRYLAVPLLRRVSDAQVALYVEEHEPGMHEVLVSAVEEAGRDGERSALAERLLADAVRQAEAVDEGRRIEQ